MAAAGTVAVLLPGAFYALQEKKKPPVALLRKHKVPIAIATDCNPGTSPLLSPTLAMNMACTLFGLTPEEALAGMTVNAARALGLAHSVGSIAAGKQADLCVWHIESLAELGYWVGLPGPERRIFAGPMPRAAAALVAIICWAGLAIQFVGDLRQSASTSSRRSGCSLASSPIITNLLVAVAMTGVAIGRQGVAVPAWRGDARHPARRRRLHDAACGACISFSGGALRRRHPAAQGLAGRA